VSRDSVVAGSLIDKAAGMDRNFSGDVRDQFLCPKRQVVLVITRAVCVMIIMGCAGQKECSLLSFLVGQSSEAELEHQAETRNV
jgi:hypothetical protein